MVFVSDQPGQADLFTADNEGNVERLTEIGGVFTPDWSSDGRFILFAAPDSAGGSDIYIMRPDGTGLQAVTSDPAKDYQPKMSPDTEHILFVSERDGNPEIYLYGVDGSLQRITDNAARDISPSWHPVP
jgi:TolB protein